MLKLWATQEYTLVTRQKVHAINALSATQSTYSGCLVISAFLIPGHFQVFQVHQESFSRSYKNKSVYIRSQLLRKKN